jgi:hypothetical protein
MKNRRISRVALARVDPANQLVGTPVRVKFWGAMAVGASACVGVLFGTIA